MQASITNKLSLRYVSVIICHLFLAVCGTIIPEPWFEVDPFEKFVTHGRDECPAGERKYGKIDPKCGPDCFNLHLSCNDLLDEKLCTCDEEKGYVRNGTSGCIHESSCQNRRVSVWPHGQFPPCPPDTRHSRLAQDCEPTCDRHEFSCQTFSTQPYNCLCDFGRGLVRDAATGQCVFYRDCPKKSEPHSRRRSHARLYREEDS